MSDDARSCASSEWLSEIRWIHTRTCSPVFTGSAGKDLHAVGLLRLDELPVEQVDQDVASARPQSVLPQLDNWTRSDHRSPHELVPIRAPAVVAW
jgi:hypothetical protein